jgi:hypothetical protein
MNRKGYAALFLIGLVVLFGWWVGHVPTPDLTMAHDPHDIDPLVDGTTVPSPDPLPTTKPVTLPTSRPH